MTLLFLAFALPPCLTLDPGRSRSQIPAAPAWYYPMLVTHILLGAIALLAACLQLWPWLRHHHPVFTGGWDGPISSPPCWAPLPS